MRAKEGLEMMEAQRSRQDQRKEGKGYATQKAVCFKGKQLVYLAS